MASIPKDLAAKARLKFSDGTETCIEVRKGSRFSNFYTIYSVQGRGRGRSITYGIPMHRGAAKDIEDAVSQIEARLKASADRSPNIPRLTGKRVWIYRKRLYRTLINMRPDELGMSRSNNKLGEYLRQHKGATAVSTGWPEGHTTLEKRWKMLTRQ